MGELFDRWRRKKERGGGRGKIWRRKLSSLPLNQMTGENDFSQIWISNCYLCLLLITFHIASGCELNSDESPCMMMMLLIIMTMNMMMLLLVQMIDRVDGPNYVDDDDFLNIPSQRAPGSCLVWKCEWKHIRISKQRGCVVCWHPRWGSSGRQKLLSIHF